MTVGCQPAIIVLDFWDERYANQLEENTALGSRLYVFRFLSDIFFALLCVMRFVLGPVSQLLFFKITRNIYKCHPVDFYELAKI